LRHARAVLAERRNAVERVELLPRNPLRVGDPVLVAAGITAARLPFVEHRHVGGPRKLLQLDKLFVAVSLEAEVVDAGLTSACRNGEVDA